MASLRLVATASLPLLTALTYFLYVGYRQRSKINELRKQGIAMPEWSWLTGHLFVLKRCVDRLPPGVNVYMAMREMSQEFAHTEIFLIDLWPVFPPTLMVFSPEAAVQISNKYSLQKTDKHVEFMEPVTGGPSLVSMNDAEWKIWRTLFNPGFSATTMTGYIPNIVDSASVFLDQLKSHAGKDLFLLDNLTTNLTMDVMIKLTLDQDLDNLRSENVLATSLRKILSWHSFWDPRILIHPLRPFFQKYYGYIMNRYIRKILESSFSKIKQNISLNSSRSEDSNALSPTKTKRTHSIISLALESYIRENSDSDSLDSLKLDDRFARYATYQIRLFLFAGNDTTSSTLVYVYHALAKYPSVLSRMREEHDNVLGTDAHKAASIIKDNPAIVNKLRYTLAVIKETLRLYPPSSSLSQGRPNISITDNFGNTYPTDGLALSIMHPVIHVLPRVWPQAKEFLPERWMVDQGHALYPDHSAFRPFEHGPRACIAQTLVYHELRIVMALTARSVNITPAYDEWDAREFAKRGLLERTMGWVGLTGNQPNTVEGERAYQTDKAGTHPADGYPCRVTLTE